MSHNHVQLAAKLSQHGIAGASFAAELDRFLESERPRLQRLWSYYRNPLRALARSDESSARPYTQAQEWGLPRRITGEVYSSTTTNRREVVIENYIAWRLDMMVRMFAVYGKPKKANKREREPRKRLRRTTPEPYRLKLIPRGLSPRPASAGTRSQSGFLSEYLSALYSPHLETEDTGIEPCLAVEGPATGRHPNLWADDCGGWIRRVGAQRT